MHKRINSHPDDEDELIALKTFIENITEELKRLDGEIANIYYFINLLSENYFEYPEDSMAVYWSLRGMP